jgi:hypothetical protein
MVLDGMAARNLLLADVESEDGKGAGLNLHKAYGKPYESARMLEFQAFAARVEEAWLVVSASAMQAQIRDWLDELETDPKLWVSRLRKGKEPDARYGEIPVFASVPPEDFGRIVLALQAPALQVLANALRERYAPPAVDHPWQRRETSFWESLFAFLSEQDANQPATTLSRWVLKEHLLPEVESIAGQLRDDKDKFDDVVSKLAGEEVTDHRPT